MNTPELAIETRGLTKRFPGFCLEGIDLTLPRGYILGLIGPNGAGKSTLIKLLLGTLMADTGTIRLLGKDPARHAAAIKAHLGFVEDTPRFYEHLTLEGFKRIVAPFYPEWEEGPYRERLARFQLNPRQRLGTLSRGMRMKFSLALALSHHAELLLLDEPTSGLDPVFRREFLDELRHLLLDERRSVLFSTQITSDLERIADYVACLGQGRLVFQTTLDELRDSWAVVKGGEELLRPECRTHFRALRRGTFGVEALTVDREAAHRDLPGEILFERPRLEDILCFLNEDAAALPDLPKGPALRG